MERTLGVIVAGGRGRRLGQGPKALARCAGRTLLERAWETASSVCDEVVVAAPRQVALPVASGVRVDDVEGGTGPLAGLVAGLRARPHERAIALAVDLPLLRRAMLELLLARLGDRSAVLPAPGGIPQPLSAVYSGTATAGLERALVQGERSVTAAAMALDPVLVGDAELERVSGGAADFLNVNTPADLLEAERMLAERRAES